MFTLRGQPCPKERRRDARTAVPSSSSHWPDPDARIATNGKSTLFLIRRPPNKQLSVVHTSPAVDDTECSASHRDRSTPEKQKLSVKERERAKGSSCVHLANGFHSFATALGAELVDVSYHALIREHKHLTTI